MIINVFCLGLTFLQLRRLGLEVGRRGGGEEKVRMYWIIAITHATFWSPLYLHTSTAWRSSQDRKSLTEEVTSVRPRARNNLELLHCRLASTWASYTPW